MNLKRIKHLLPIAMITIGMVAGTSCLGTESSSANQTEGRSIWFDVPATHFTESLPLGNGRLGAMIFGGVEDERIVLNESGMWSGSPQNADRTNAAAALPEIRQLLLEGKNAEAEQLVNANFTCAGEGSGRGRGANVPYGCYQTLGNLRLHFISENVDSEVTNYRRELNLGQAISRMTYTIGHVTYQRETFISKPDEVLVIRLTADATNTIAFDATLDRPERSTIEALGPDTLKMYGQLNDGREGGTGVRYCALLQARANGGEVKAQGDKLQVRGATEVLLFLTAATDIHTFAGREANDPEATATADLSAAAAKSFSQLRQAHLQDYTHFYDRVSLRLGSGSTPTPESRLPTPQRLEAFASGTSDVDLAALYFDFGRYLLISSSRPGGLPANLQGIWAEEIQTPWNADWHLNINAQMNYWPAEVCNLSELHEPLLALTASLQEPGARTAKAYYSARGWVAFLLANPWGFTSPGESASWGSTVSCSAWLCQHLWEHYLFSRDAVFLQWAYPILKGSALFYLDMLIEEPTHGWLVTAPSNSSENAFIDEDRTTVHVCMGPTCDQQLLRYLFQACIEAASILDVDEALQTELQEARARLAPTQVGADGRVMEWLKERKEADPRHRHVSHLWGLYPGDEIAPETTPELAQAARRTLDVRGDAGTGWSLAFKLGMWARLGDGERAHQLLKQHLKPANQQTSGQRWSGGTFPNLFDSHPPFQIDGNFGGTAAIAEMLLQSQRVERKRPNAGGRTEPAEIRVLQLLPALPEAWAEGRVRGLKTRDGFEVDMEWAEGRLTRAMVRSKLGHSCKICYGDRTVELETEPGSVYVFDESLETLR